MEVNGKVNTDSTIKRKPKEVEEPESEEPKPKRNSIPNSDSGEETTNNDDHAYFKGYENTGIHSQMIGDYQRTFTYREAILKNYKLFYGKVVADIGCGTGILSVFCVQAGAKRVYAVEASDIAGDAETIAAANGMEDKIKIIKGRVEDVTLPEKVDIIVSEWMGYMLFYESMLESVLVARDKWLKPGGSIFPEKAQLYIALTGKTDQWVERVDFWHDVLKLHKVDMSAMTKRATAELCGHATVCQVFPDQVVSHPARVLEIDLRTCNTSQIDDVTYQFKLSSFGDTDLHAFSIWFSVHFPQDIHLSTSPYEPDTHWHQTVFYVEPQSLKQGTIIEGEINIRKNPLCRRFLSVAIRYAKDEVEKKNYEYEITCETF